MTDDIVKVDKDRVPVVYVDDEPRNLSLFEMSVPDDWEVSCFESAVEALKAIKEIKPAIIVSDQRMPNMTGLEFLEVAASIVPDSVRFVVTGQTDEDIIIALVRRAKIFDYITKPWDVEDLIARLTKGVDFHNAVSERNRLLDELQVKNNELSVKNAALLQITEELKEAQAQETKLREDLEGLTHWQMAEALKKGPIEFPARRDLACIAFDIIGSSSLADVYIEDRPIRSLVMLMFKELILKNGGLIESQGGDSCYAHFGAFDTLPQPCSSAFHAAREFRVKLRNFSAMHGVQVECGIGLHFARQTVIDQDLIRISLVDGSVRCKKDIHTQSREVDLLHRMEKLMHLLPGTNIIMSKVFSEHLKQPESKLIEVGRALFRGQQHPVELLILKSDQVGEDDLLKLRERLAELSASQQEAA